MVLHGRNAYFLRADDNQASTVASGAPKRIAAVYDKWWRGGRKTDVDYQNALSLY